MHYKNIYSYLLTNYKKITFYIIMLTMLTQTYHTSKNFIYKNTTISKKKLNNMETLDGATMLTHYTNILYGPASEQ